MNSALVIIGALLMVDGALFTFLTLGIGIICTWPVILIGLILFIIGLVIPGGKTTIIQQQTMPQKSKESRPYCSECGRASPFDSQMCPYCGKRFGAHLEEEQKT